MLRTPLIKARRGTETIEFFSEREFHKWREETPKSDKFKVKYYKGLGTSTSEEFRDYFSRIDDLTVDFKYSGKNCNKALLNTFGEDSQKRKTWLLKYDGSKSLSHENEVSLKNFIDTEMGAYSSYAVRRSIPSVVDGLKDVQRKILWVCFNRPNSEIKVSQLSGAVSERTAYHHGESSLENAIVSMARKVVGSPTCSNINLLEPIGQFGSRYAGGEDAAAARYLFTKLAPLTRKEFFIFNLPKQYVFSNFHVFIILKLEKTYFS